MAGRAAEETEAEQGDPMIVLEIRCDDCDVCGDSSGVKSAHAMRRELRRQGWRQDGKRDFCNKCLKAARPKPS